MLSKSSGAWRDEIFISTAERFYSFWWLIKLFGTVFSKPKYLFNILTTFIGYILVIL